MKEPEQKSLNGKRAAVLAADLRNAGVSWKDGEAVVDHGFVTSRSPDDLSAFCAKMCGELAEWGRA